VDYVKIDWCYADSLDAPVQYRKFRDAIAATGRPIVFSICEWGHNLPWEWAPKIGNLWRTTGDIDDSWASMLNNLDVSAQYSAVAGPGHWNDPDMLEVGNGHMTSDEYRAHFSLWAIQAAPLLAGNDLRSMDDTTRAILTNTEVIAVDQDSLGAQGTLVFQEHTGLQTWVKPLRDGSRAVALLNRTDSAAVIAVPVRRLGITSPTARVRDLWAHADLAPVTGTLKVTVPSHGVAMLRVAKQ
jgi:alpha-galactosidase